jgi:ketosteroid isomerase-like protein
MRTIPVEPQVRRQRGDLFHQRRHQQFDRQIGHHHAEMPLAPRGIEIVTDKKSAHLIERLRQWRAQRLSTWRQFHPGADPHQQRIAKNIAQPRQAWLVAGCERPIRIAARLTLASSSSASRATRRLRSSEAHGTKAGVRYENEYRLVYRLERGKIVEIREYCDSALCEAVLGVFPAPTQAPV